MSDGLNRHDLSDAEWVRLAPLLPGHPRQGHRWADHRMVINGILFRTRAGCPWRDLPECYGNWKTVYNRHRRWSWDGTWDKVLDALRVGCDQGEAKDWTVGVDSAIARAHHHAAGARRAAPPTTQGAASNNTSPGTETETDGLDRRDREALSRSRGGFSTMIHLVADRRCRPIARLTSPGQHGDSPYFTQLLDAVRIHRRGPGRPRRRPARVLADKAYSSRDNRAYLRRRGIKAVIPEKNDQQAHRRARGRAGGRPPAFDPERYKQRNTAERCINKLKGFRAVAAPTGTANENASTKEPSTSPRSRSGFATPTHDLQDTP